MNLSNNTKIILSIISTIILYVFTNLSTPSINNSNSALYNFFYHKAGTVCPFGIWCGKIMILICILQVYLLYMNKYTERVKNITLLLIILGFIASFMNPPLQKKIIPVFILQLFIVLL